MARKVKRPWLLLRRTRSHRTGEFTKWRAVATFATEDSARYASVTRHDDADFLVLHRKKRPAFLRIERMFADAVYGFDLRDLPQFTFSGPPWPSYKRPGRA